MTSGQPHFDLQVFGSTLVLHALLAAFMAGYAAWLIARRRLPGPTPLDPAIGALVIVYIAAVADSVYPRVSWEAALLIGAVVITFYAFHDFDFLSPEALVRCLAGLGGVAGTIALYNVGEDYGAWLGLVKAVDGSVGLRDLIPPAVPRVSGVGDHVNIIAMAFNLTLPFALALLLRPRPAFDRYLGALATLMTLVALFFTVSRGAWLGTLVAVPVFFALYLLRDLDLRPDSFSPAARRRVALLFVAALLGLAAAALLLSQWDSRPEWLFRSSLSPRYDALSTGWQIFLDRPWLGAGPYTYSLLYNVYSGRFPIENIHAHNAYLTALVDIGLLGAAVLAAGGLALAGALARAFATADADKRVLVGACVAALASLAVHAFLETPNTWSTALLPLAVVLAVCFRFEHRTAAPDGRASSKLNRAVPLLIIPGLLVSWVVIDLPHARYSESLDALLRGDFTRAARDAGRAADGDSSLAAYQFHAGVTSAITFIIANQRGDDAPASLLDEAIRRLRAGLEQEPRSAVGYANLALALRLENEARHTRFELTDRRAEAAEAARAALQRAPADATIAAVAGTVLEWADQPGEAFAAYTRALSHDAGLVQSPFWETNEFRRSIRAAALDASALTACERGRVTAIYRGYPDDLAMLEAQCRQLVDSAPANARARSDLAMILYGLTRYEDARREAGVAVRQVPDSAYARTALAVTLVPDADLAAVRHELMLAAYLGDADAALFLAYTYADSPWRSSPVVANLALPRDNHPMPDEVAGRLKKALEPAAHLLFDNGIQRYRLGILYYRVRFRRESPTTILIPGEWLAFASPRALLILEALAGR